ncbi:MAG: hypothetical protein IPJ41_05145 [Phycisphaerales bacterium]|nr:hypothetical protein [Phycisphaerales bacterium]
MGTLTRARAWRIAMGNGYIGRLRGRRRGGIVAGCLIALGVVVVLLVIGGIIVAMNWRNWTGRGLHAIAQKSIAQSSLPIEEQNQVMAVIDNFTAEFEAGKVSAGQFGEVFKQFGESPIVPAMIVAGIQTEYIDKSTLTDEEKAEGSKDLSRFVHGVRNGQISQTKIDDVTQPIAAPLGSNSKFAIHSNNVNIELKKPEDVTPEELKEFLGNAKAEADKAGVADEKFIIDWSDELQKVIDKALGRIPADTPADAPHDAPSESGG